MEEYIRYFQYLEGEKSGMVVESSEIIAEDDDVYIEFSDGDRCNQKMIAPIGASTIQEMYMAEISSPTNIWKMTEKWVGRQEEEWDLNEAQVRVCIQPFVEGRKIIDYIPPRPPSAFGKITKIINEPKPEPKLEDKYKEDPVWVMLNKSKKFDTAVSLDLIISLPKKSLFNIINESFDNGGKNMIKYIIETMDTESIKKALKKALNKSYEAEPKEEIESLSYEPVVIEEAIVGSPIIKKAIHNNSSDELLENNI